MEGLRGLFAQYWTLEFVVQLLVPVALLAWRLPLRPRAGTRVAAVMAGLAALAVVPIASGALVGLNEVQSLLVFSTLLILFAGAIRFVFNVSFWPSLFCATAGYTLQNFATGATLLVRMLLTASPRRPLHDPAATVVALMVPAAVYAVSYLVFIKRVNREGLAVVENKAMLLMFVLVAVTVIGFDLIIKSLVADGISLGHAVLMRIVHLIICVFVLFAEYELLYARNADNRRAETERLLAERERQYRLSRENIEAINIKCHDIRHQIRHLADSRKVVDANALADIAREVNVYDSVVETGNEALDTILTEKGLTCSGEGIVLSVIADGAALGFMAPSDIYSLFGNALDNAIEAVRAVEDPERRTITLSVCRRLDMVVVNVENHCAVEPRFEKGLPVTTKADKANHGFGGRSMRSIAESYGGTLHAGTEDGTFYLNILLTVPEHT